MEPPQLLTSLADARGNRLLRRDNAETPERRAMPDGKVIGRQRQ